MRRKEKVMKRKLSIITAVFLSILMLFESFPALALTEGNSYSYKEQYLDMYYDTGRWETANGDVHDNYGQIALRNLTSTGEPIYCIQIYEGCDGSAATAENIMYTDLWNNELNGSSKTIITRVSIYGYPNYTYGYSSVEAQLATQILLWEAEIHARTNFTDGVTSFAKNINATTSSAKRTLSAALECYLEILEACQNHSNRPDFGTTTVELKGAGESNAAILTDKNGTLSNFKVSSNNSSIKVSQSGNTLKIWSTTTGDITAALTFTKLNTDINSAFALTGANQTLFYGTIADPVVTRLNVKISLGEIKIVKTSEDNKVSNIKFRITGNGYDETVTTGNDGTITVPNLNAGTYTVSEITESKYVDPQSQTVKVVGGETASVSFSNILKKFMVTVSKQDSETGYAQGDSTLEGAVYGIYNGKELIDTYTTDSEGSFTTTYYVCGDNWTLKEISPSEGYQLDDTVYSIEAQPSEFTIEHNTVEMTVNENIKKGNIAIIKHADDGSTQIETPEDGAEFEVYLKSAGSYDNAEESERDVLITDEYGFAESKDLPYGVYTVHQTSGWEGYELVSDFDVYISENGKVYRYLINNAVFESLIEIVKVDAETGKTIPLSGTGFKVKDLSSGKFITQHINYPTPVDIDTFYTDTTGKLMLPETLTYGSYELYEVASPNGYVLNKEPVQFEVDGSQTTVTVTFKDLAQKGTITVSKQGDSFSSVSESGDLYKPVYSEVGLEGAVFEIYADEDIITPDGTVRAEKDELVATITTGIDGTAISKPLYLGKYKMFEKTAPYGFVSNTEAVYFELVYAGQEIEITNISTTVKNERQKVQIDLRKVLEQDELFGLGMNGEIQNVSFGLYAASDLTAADGSIIPADGLLEIASCAGDGTLTFTTDLPVGSEVYIREYSTDSHYLISDQKYPVKFEYAGQDTAVVHISANNGEPIENDLIRGSVMGLKVDEDGFRIGGALFGLFAEDETEFTEENALMTCLSNEIGVFLFENIPFGDYIVREIKPAPAFVSNDTSYFVSVAEQDQIIEIIIENQFLTCSVQVIKTDKDDKSKRLSGAVFEVYIDVDRNKEFDPNIDLLVGELNEFETGVYRMDGLRYNGYFLHEKAAPDGYYGDDGYYYFEITKDQEVVTIENIADTGLFVNESIPQPPVEEYSPKTGAEDYLLPAVLLATGNFSAILVLAFRKRKARSK